jgi:TonB family protein
MKLPKAHHLTAVFCLFFSHLALGQDTTYFDMYFEKVKTQSKSVYTEIIDCASDDNNRCAERIFLSDNMKLISVRRYSDYKRAELDGRCQYFFPNGNLGLETNYQKGLQKGKEKSFFENGQLKRLLIWDADTIVSGTFFNADGTPNTNVTQSDLYDFINQVPPAFPGGEQQLLKFLFTNIIYPEKAKENNWQGVVVMRFVIQKNGVVTDVEVIKSVQKVLDNEAMRVIKAMPRWKPGSVNGRPVRVRFTLPITFILEG